MELNNKKKFLFMGLEVIFFLGVFFAVILPVSWIYVNKFIGHPKYGQWFADNSLLLLVINDMIQFPLIILLYKLIKKKNLLKSVNFVKIETKNLVLSIFIGIAAGVFTMALVHFPWVTRNLPSFQPNIWFLVGSNIFIFLFSLLINPLYKEVLFRGIIFKALDKNMNTWVALIIQSVIYGCIIQGIELPVRIYGFLSALLMGILYTRGRSIWSPIIAGILCNISYFMLFKTPLRILKGPGLLYVTAMTALVALLVLSGYLIYSNRPASAQKE